MSISLSSGSETLLRRCALGLGLVLLSASAWSQATAAERLEQLRQSLLSRVAQASTRVDTTAWIDSQGRLQESSRFRQSLQFAQVQGAAAADAAVQAARPAQDLVRLEGLSAQRLKACVPASVSGLQHVMAFEIDIDDTVPAHWQTHLRTAIETGPWQRPAQAPWRLLPASPARLYASRYEQALMDGPRSTHAWRLVVRVQKPSPTAPALKLVMTLTPSDAAQNPYQDESSLAVDTLSSAWSAPQWSAATHERLNDRLNHWQQRMQQWLSCSPVRPAVTAQANGMFTLAAGQLAGVKKGDEWVLLQPERLASQSLEPGTLDHLLHATVVEVTPHSAQLRVEAGMPAAAAEMAGTWQAWTWADLQAMMAPSKAPKVADPAAQLTRQPLAGLFQKFAL